MDTQLFTWIIKTHLDEQKDKSTFSLKTEVDGNIKKTNIEKMASYSKTLEAQRSKIVLKRCFFLFF